MYNYKIILDNETEIDIYTDISMNEVKAELTDSGFSISNYLCFEGVIIDKRKIKIIYDLSIYREE